MQDYRLSELESGLRVVSETLTGVRSISIGFWIGTGSRDETIDESGISHLLEHMLFKGTERFDAVHIAEAFDAIGAEINAFTAKENTVLHCRFLDQHLEEAFDITSEMILKPVYREMDVEREVVLEEIAMYEDEPQDKVHDVFSGVVYGSHPLGRPVIGSSEVIREVSRESISRYHSSHYRPENIVIAAAGNIEHEQLVDMASKLERSDAGTEPEREGISTREPEPRAKFVYKETDQCHICMGGPGISNSDDRRYTLGILDTILGGAISSRLFQAVREKRGLAYSIYSFAEQYCDTGDVGIYFGTRPENVGEVVSIIASELERLQDDPATDEELARAKESAKGRFVLTMEMTQARMNRLGRCVLSNIDLYTLDEIISKIDAVDRAALKELAAEFYTPSKFSVAGIGSSEDIFWESIKPVNDALVASC